jgi:hypothetical protein
MLWGGLDDQRFVEINSDESRISIIKKQLDNQAAQWVKIDIPKGRKQSPPYYVIVPRNVAALLPVLRANRKPVVSRQRLIIHWNTGLRRAGFEYKRFGPHTLRSVFRSEATRRGLNPIIAEFQLGHRPDPLNYQRLNQDLKWVLSEFDKAWQTQQAATTDDLKERDGKIERLEDHLTELAGLFESYLRLSKPETVEADKVGADGKPLYFRFSRDKLNAMLKDLEKKSKKG